MMRSWNPAYPPKDAIPWCREAKSFCTSVKVIGISAACLVGFFVLYSAMENKPFYGQRTSESGPWRKDVDFDDIINRTREMGEYSAQPVKEPKDKLLGGLLPEGLDVNSCVSRYQSALNRKEQKHQPSSYLVSRLRKYEALHKQCGPFTESYNRSLEYLKSGSHSQYTNSTGCKYVIWTHPIHGLGNRILSLASAFLYALLTNRVLLVDPESEVPDLFCEPFEVSWLLPSDFPLIGNFSGFDKNSPQSFGTLLKNISHGSSNSSSLPPYLYLHLLHDYDDDDKRFFCNQDQPVVQNVTWLIAKSNVYFAPALFSVSTFQQEISSLFPDLGTVFHHLGRYLFHPTNFVWGLITTYYDTNLARADERIGIQIRVFEEDPELKLLDQIMVCAAKENLLPLVNGTEPVASQSGKLKTKAVLIASLEYGYFKAMRSMYWKHYTITGEVIEVHQPSHEKYQYNDKKMHNIKAWAEMYLLSLTDKLVTSADSTFGYVAHSLGGLKPWILYQPENHVAPDPPCRRAVSKEPCMHAPPYYDCMTKQWTGPGAKLDPHVQHCDDKWYGIKFVDREENL